MVLKNSSIPNNGDSAAASATPSPAQPQNQSQPLTITPEFSQALSHLRDGHSLFLTGKAGTGKSTLIRLFQQQTDRNIITVAPTGIAALNVDGYTIHRLFSFHTNITPEEVASPRYYPGQFQKTLAKLDTLIIDEASMVRADLFDSLATALKRFGPKPDEPFGGVQVVLVGDLYQLPPVVRDTEAAYFETHYRTPYFFSAHNYSASQFPTVELTTVFRQIGDSKLVGLLNAVREGALITGARKELNQRTDADFEPTLDEFWLTLATTNRIVASRNRQMLERLDAPSQVFTAQLRGELDGFEFPTEEKLELAVGAQVMMLSNDPSERWVNGSIGRIEDIQIKDGEPAVQVRLRDGATITVEPHLWEITRPTVEGSSLRHEIIGTFRQLPMKLAWAITIHKSQGQTLDRVVVDLTGGTFANGQLYVALSRCTSLEGLVLKRDVLPRDLKTDIRVKRFLNAIDGSEDFIGNVYISALCVGNEGDRYRPRPVEIAVVTDDGDEATTIVNPTSDLFGAQTEFGITTRDVQLAPILSEAWAALSPLLAGRIPIGVGIDRLLGIIDFELKRDGLVEPMPLGVEIPKAAFTAEEQAALRSPTALTRARTLAAVGKRLGFDKSSKTQSPDGTASHKEGTPFPQNPRGVGYLASRVELNEVTATDTASGFVVGGNLSADDDPAAELGRLLGEAWERLVDHNQEVVDRIQRVEQHFGVQILPTDFALEAPVQAEDIFLPGARVCFTGTAIGPDGQEIPRLVLEGLAESLGLQISKNMTKTRTEVLVVAERGTQSRKAKNAAQWGKPVVAVEDFIKWAEHR